MRRCSRAALCSGCQPLLPCRLLQPRMTMPTSNWFVPWQPMHPPAALQFAAAGHKPCPSAIQYLLAADVSPCCPADCCSWVHHLPPAAALHSQRGVSGVPGHSCAQIGSGRVAGGPQPHGLGARTHHAAPERQLRGAAAHVGGLLEGQGEGLAVLVVIPVKGDSQPHGLDASTHHAASECSNSCSSCSCQRHSRERPLVRTMVLPSTAVCCHTLLKHQGAAALWCIPGRSLRGLLPEQLVRRWLFLQMLAVAIYSLRCT